MELKRLNHLVALAQERNFGRAASSVHLSQPAFSRSIQAAEAEFGLQLFDRGSAEVSCTPAGAFVIERARKLLVQSRRLERDVDLYRERAMGNLAFGASPFPAATLLPELMTELRTRFPAIRCRVQVSSCQVLTDCLRREEIDFFLADARDVPEDNNLILSAIGRQRARFYVRAGHPLAGRASVRASELVPYGLASGRLAAQAEATLRKLLAKSEDEGLPVAVECDDVQLIKRITLGTDTVMVGTEGVVREELAAGLLQALEMHALPRSYAQISVVSLSGRSKSPIAQYALEFLGRMTPTQDDNSAHPSARPPG